MLAITARAYGGVLRGAHVHAARDVRVYCAGRYASVCMCAWAGTHRSSCRRQVAWRSCVVAQVVHDDDDGQGDDRSDDQGGDQGVEHGAEHGGDHWDEQNLK